MRSAVDALSEKILPLCQYFSYIQVYDEEYMSVSDDSPLWDSYSALEGEAANFAMRHVSSPADIYPVFHDLFSRPGVEA